MFFFFTKEVTQYNTVSDRSIIPRINPPKGFNLDGLSSENKDAKPDKLAISRPLSGYSHYARQVCITIFIIFIFPLRTIKVKFLCILLGKTIYRKNVRRTKYQHAAKNG